MRKPSKPAPVRPERLLAFVQGTITLGELGGVSKAEQTQIAQHGFDHLEQGKLKTAQRIFEGLLALDPRDDYFLLALGTIAQRRARHEEAERLYSQALELAPVSPHALANRGEVRILLGRPSEGTEDLIAAIRADPELTEEATRRASATLKLVRKRVQGRAPRPRPRARADRAPRSRARPRRGRPRR